VDRALRSERRTAWRLQRDAVDALHDLTPLAESGPMLEAALVLASDDEERLAWVAAAAARVWHFGLAERACQRLGEAMSASDIIDAAYMRFMLGDSSTALARLVELGDEELGVRDRVHACLGRSAYRLDASPTPDIDAAARDLEAGAAEAIDRDTFTVVERTELEGIVALGRARLAMARGELPAAASVLRRVVRDDGRPFVSILLGDALAGLGDIDGAQDAWSQAHDGAHPESFHAGEARRRMLPPFR
jgi:tetratricopeptide (TPR) repeat protein